MMMLLLLTTVLNYELKTAVGTSVFVMTFTALTGDVYKRQIEVIQELEQVVFPGYFGDDSMARVQPEYHVGFWLNHLYDKLKEQVEIALLYQGEEDTQKVSERSAQICEKFFRNLPKVQELSLIHI